MQEGIELHSRAMNLGEKKRHNIAIDIESKKECCGKRHCGVGRTVKRETV
jgi:hypothetical protein